MKAAALVALAGSMAAPVFAHDGRRFQIEVVDNQLVAQGVNTIDNFVPASAPFNTTGQPVKIDDKGLRPYTNAQHTHWSDLNGLQVPQTDLPGYDMGLGTQVLQGFDVSLTVTGGWKWENVSDVLVPDPSFGLNLPQLVVAPGTVPTFVPLDTGEQITAIFTDPSTLVSQQADTVNGGTIEIVSNFDGIVSVDVDGLADNTGSNGYDRDIDYFLGNTPGLARDDTLYVMTSVLSTDAPGIADSETVYTIFSPDGMGPSARLHFGALFLEDYLSFNVIPEPGTGLVMAMSASVLLVRRRSGRA